MWEAIKQRKFREHQREYQGGRATPDKMGREGHSEEETLKQKPEWSEEEVPPTAGARA